ncbi:unnamed protein product [Ostreobium quekettii]|uniref:SART-1 protein n=1 Tax=Ostreobium quekettii TaxID=121088 RepID=A0A8S1INN2_9CHLO|nr:unnamed protein product [Ostreobium quekettii]
MAEGLETIRRPVSDFYTPEEMGVEMRKPKKAKKRKLRQRKEGVLDIVEELERQAEEGGGAQGGRDHGSRKGRGERAEQKEKDWEARRSVKAARYEQALEAANIQSERLKQLAEEAADVSDEEDDDILLRARKVAQKSESSTQRFEAMADSARERRLKQSKRKDAVDQALLFTDTTEFCRTIELGESAADGGQGDAMQIDGLEMDGTKTTDTKDVVVKEVKVEDDKAGLGASSSKPAQRKTPGSRWGNWVVADADDGGEEAARPAPSRPTQPAADPAQDNPLRDRPLGKGVGAALEMFRDRGELAHKFDWVGRTNDMKKGRLIGVDDVYTGGANDDRLAQSIEAALTRKDETGRILTPKQAFRELSYAFHGKGPSKNTVERRTRKMKEEYLRRRNNLNQEQQLEQLKRMQKVQKSAFVVLAGKGRVGVEAGRVEPSKNKKKVVVGAEGTTPLTGKKKVEVMLGLGKGGPEGSMGPPAPRGGRGGQQ